MSIEKLCIAAEKGDLAQIQAILKEGVDINGIHPIEKTRPIDFAAQNGHFEVINFLLDNGARLEVHPDYPQTNLLYWVANCVNQKKKQALVFWLLENERYQKLGCNLHENHLYATLGAIKADLDEDQLDNLGLSPWHYFMTANPVDLLVKTLKSNADFVNFFNQDKKITQGVYNGMNPLMWAACDQKFELLSAVKEINPKLSIDLYPKIDFYEETFPYSLAHRKRWQDLQLLAELYPEQIVDLNATGINDSVSRSLMYVLIENNQWQLLQNLLDRDPTQIIDIGAKPTYKNSTLYSIAFKLALHRQWHLLQTLAKRSPCRVNLNEFVKAEDAYVSLALILAMNKQWELLQNFADNDPNQIVYLDRDYKIKISGRISVVLCLASWKQWALLKNLAARDPNQYVDLNLTIEEYGVTIAYGLAVNGQWDILNIFLGNFDASKEPVNLNATPKNSKISLAQLLVKAQQIDLLIKLLSHPRCKIDAEHPFTLELIPLLLNSGKESLVNDIMDRYSDTEIALILNHLETTANPEIKQQASDYLYYYLTAGYEKRILITDENLDSQTLSNCVEAAQGLCNALSKIEKKSSYYPKAQLIKADFLQALLPYSTICDVLLKEVPELFPSLDSGAIHSIADLPAYYQLKTEIIETYYLAGPEGVSIARNLQKEMMREFFHLKANQPTQESNKKRKSSGSNREGNENSHNNSSTFFSANKKDLMNAQEPALVPEKKLDPDNNNNNNNFN